MTADPVSPPVDPFRNFELMASVESAPQSAEETPNTVQPTEGEDNGIPYVGMKFSTENEAYDFYNEYAARIGFSIRKSKRWIDASGVVRHRTFVCSKEGLKLDDQSSGVKKDNALVMRTDCKASIYLNVMDGMWVVTRFNPDHNHKLAEPELRKFLRSNRRALDKKVVASMSCKSTVQPEEDEAEDDVIAAVPSIGMKVCSEEEAYDMYNKYAKMTGFTIRKSSAIYNTKGLLRHRNYVCSKEGLSEDDRFYGLKEGQRLGTRTDCKASIRFTVTDGVWEVTRFDPNHNHELVDPAKRKFLRSRLQSSKARPADIRRAVHDSHSALHAGSVGMIEAWDIQSVINLFKHKQAEDPTFFYAVQVDKNNCMSNFFWRDGRSRMDYDYFGDVVVFDTTFHSNKYNLVCAPFVGVNNHANEVLFGCAFLLDETITSFIWLFESFLESMGNRQPRTIFTNQGLVLEDAVEKVFPNTHHRQCLWQTSKIARQHLLDLYADPDFKILFDKCLNDCSNELEFQSTWDEMIKKFHLADNEWLKELYDCRGKWCPAFSLDIFSAGMRPTQRSESTNHVFQQTVCNTMNLIQLVHQYEEISEHMRLVDLEEDSNCNQELPAIASSSAMLKQAADAYTTEIFKLFEEEAVESLSIVMTELVIDGTLHTFELSEEGHRNVHTVHFNYDTCAVRCSCKMFESMGLLCRHALRVLNMRTILQIPAQYILKRWTKFARKGFVAPDHTEFSCKSAKSSPALLCSRLMYKAFCAVDKSLLTVEGSEVADAVLHQLIEQAENQIATLNSVGESIMGDSKSIHVDAIDDTADMHCSLHESQVVSLPCVGDAERNARPSRQLEKKRKTKASQSNIPLGGDKRQQCIVGPTGRLFDPSQNPPLFNPSLCPSGVYFPLWAFGHPNFQPTSRLQTVNKIPLPRQDCLRSSRPKNGHT